MKLLSKINATFFLLTISCTPLIANVGGMSGSNIFTIEGGSSTDPTYRIVSASTFGPAVFQGTVSVVSGNDITFATDTDDNNDTIYPFFAAGSFDPDVMIPQVSATYDANGSVTGVSFSNTHYSNMFTSSQGFTSAPQVIISPSDTGGDDAEVTANLTSGEITSFSVASGSGGSGYTTEPDVTIVAGPHFARIIDQSSAYYGRCFLISANTRTTLTLDMSNADNPLHNAEDYFSEDTLVEVVPAATLGSIFGSYDLDDSNWNSADSWWTVTGAEVDWVYIFESKLGGYTIYTHIEESGGLNGWYSRGEGYDVKCNNTVIYPDEAFIIARRSAGTVTIQSEIAFSDAPGQILLPESGERYIANNPFGMDLLLTELIPSTEIDDDDTIDTKFRAGDDDNDTDKDTITILAGALWKEYWYQSGVNSGVTTAMKAGARSVSGGVSTSDLFIGSGSVTALQSCSDTAGSSTVTNYNDGNYTKISASNITRDLTGFTITLSDIQGYMLSDDGANEVNAITGETVDTNGTGSVVYSNISGNFEVVGGASGFVVIEKQRDVNFKDDEGSPAWNIGNVGAGYDITDSTATWYAIGGGGSGAKGTITTNSSGQYSSFNLTSPGSGYSSTPQIVISGGGWRYDPASDAPQDDIVIGASDGIIISRGATGGEKSFIEISSPTAE
jgi:hypothetical protein